MKVFKIILTVIFGIALLGNFSMMFKGEFVDGWNYFALIVIALIFFILVRSVGREKADD